MLVRARALQNGPIPHFTLPWLLSSLLERLRSLNLPLNFLAPDLQTSPYVKWDHRKPESRLGHDSVKSSHPKPSRLLPLLSHLTLKLQLNHQSREPPLPSLHRYILPFNPPHRNRSQGLLFRIPLGGLQKTYIKAHQISKHARKKCSK